MRSRAGSNWHRSSSKCRQPSKHKRNKSMQQIMQSEHAVRASREGELALLNVFACDVTVQRTVKHAINHQAT
mgnify:CR=1 FL=1